MYFTVNETAEVSEIPNVPIAVAVAVNGMEALSIGRTWINEGTMEGPSLTQFIRGPFR